MIKGSTRLMKTGCGHLYITINEDDKGQLFELFTSMGKAGGCASSQAEAIGRLISLALRSNIEPEAITSQLKGVRCHQPAWHSGGQILSCADAIAMAIENIRQAGIKATATDTKTPRQSCLLAHAPNAAALLSTKAAAQSATTADLQNAGKGDLRCF